MSVRQELHAYIDTISEGKLIALRPLLCALADESIVIETNLTDEERALVAKGMKDYKEAPGSFIRLN